ncbi:uncharacterized protein B0P05DRAFT_550600 [Gilbertella persicaria]|uniref:uncharacterized protein n=1 Tax=Gilbertella persicaria TaxID=101096 RepID=UPI00221F5C01|nr:uncharacterized protein B0P05DRAFT_550600 [Gilbertella persicaria]KAI8070660.1 hypothetical protein B0P05DRAFT_550600 [Gilbertella persicaria]
MTLKQSNACVDIEDRINVIEFYHEVLWESQQDYIDTIQTHNEKRVSFSSEPPKVYEYEPEPSGTLYLFDYEIYKQTIQQQEEEDESTLFDFYHDNSSFQFPKLTSPSHDFRPIVNQAFLHHRNDSFIHSPLASPTVSEEEKSLKEHSKKPKNYYQLFKRNTRQDNKTEPGNNQTLFRRVLVKIKLPPRLMVQRKSSFLSLRKKISSFIDS